MIKGIWRKVYKIDLSRGECRTEDVPDHVYQYFMGGGGIVAYYLWKECPAGTGPFDQENRLIMAGGPLTGVRQSGLAKWSAGAIGANVRMNVDSEASGSWGIEMKACGVDALVISGRAKGPVYIKVSDEGVEIKDAGHIWGKDAYETEDLIKAAEGDEFAVAGIGIAGERLARFANVATAKKSFLGRCGLGAVMGSKNLKAVAVHGTRNCEFHDPERLRDLNKAIHKRMLEQQSLKPKEFQISWLGTAMATALFAPQGNLPVKNYSLGDFPEGVANLGGRPYVEKLNAKPWPCRYCVIQCHNRCEVKEGPYAYKGKGPEYESFAMMGFNLLISNQEAVAYAGELANKYALDTISLGGVLAWAMESFEKGVLTREDIYGIDLTWGNADAVIEMVRKIGERAEGLGWWLGEGCQAAAAHYGKGSEDWAVAMKGQEIAAHSWRAQYISALNYCTGVAAGPNHEKGNSQHIWVGHILLPEWGIDHVENEERWSWEKAAERNAKFHDYCNVINSAVHCKFQEFASYNLTDLLNTINAATGLAWTQEDLRRCGERITTLQKILNIRYGLKKEDDFRYPKRFMEPVNEGPAAGKIPEGLDQAILDYYAYRQWDGEGKPTAELLVRLGMEAYVEQQTIEDRPVNSMA
jgi:aldehyde:ferredoxin oxidoreductase